MGGTETTPDSAAAYGGTAADHRRGWVWWAGWAGVVAPVLFTVIFFAQELFRQDEYSPIEETVSALEAGPNGWVQQVNFVVFGLLTMFFAAGLHRCVRPGGTGVVGPALMFFSGIGAMLAATFPLREDSTGVTYDPGLHFVAGIIFFSTSALSLLALSFRLRRDSDFASLSRYSFAAGAACLLAFFVMGAFVIPDDAPLHDWAGLGQRIVVLALLFPCRVVLSVRLVQVSRDRTGRARHLDAGGAG